MAFKFTTRYFVYDYLGHYYMTDSYSSAYLNACRRSTNTCSCVYILSTETCYLEKIFYDRSVREYHCVTVNATNPNIDIL